MRSGVLATVGILTVLASASVVRAQLPAVTPGAGVPTRGIPVTVITGAEIRSRNVTRLDELFQGSVPGVIATDHPTDGTASLRARGRVSPSAITAMRVFVDGVELANPGAIRSIDPEQVDRIEISTGAAAGALVGATGGVVSIHLRQGGTASTSSRTEISVAGSNAPSPAIDVLSTAAAEQSLYNEGTSMTQRHAMTITGGVPALGYMIGGGYRSNGNYAPSAAGHVSDMTMSVTTKARWLQANVIGLLSHDDQDIPSSRAPGTVFVSDGSLKERGIGGTLTLTPTSWWRHDLRYGYNDHRVGVDAAPLPVGSSPSSTRYEDRDRVLNTSYAYVTSLTLPTVMGARPLFSAGYDYTRQDLRTESRTITMTATDTSTSTTLSRRPRSTSGVFGVLGVNIGDVSSMHALALSAGVRRAQERHVDAVWLPQLTAAYTTHMITGLTITARAAHGVVRDSLPTFVPTFGPGFTPTFLPSSPNPQRVASTDVGLDVTLANGLSVSVTSFVQDGRDGVAPVLVDSVMTMGPFGPSYIYQYQYLNVTTFRTRGVEASLQWTLGAFSARGAYSTSKTRFSKLAPGYGSSMSIGQFVDPDVPRQNGALWLAYSFASTGTTLGFETRYLGSYTSYDYAFRPVPAGGIPRMTYPGFAQYNLNVSHPVLRDVRMIGYIHNLTNTERYAASNIEYARGRQFGLGARLSL